MIFHLFIHTHTHPTPIFLSASLSLAVAFFQPSDCCFGILLFSLSLVTSCNNTKGSNEHMYEHSMISRTIIDASRWTYHRQTHIDYQMVVCWQGHRYREARSTRYLLGTASMTGPTLIRAPDRGSQVRHQHMSRCCKV